MNLSVHIRDTEPFTDLREIITEQDWRDAAVVLQVLRPNLNIESFLNDRTRLAAEGYRLIGIKVEGKMMAVASYVITPHPVHFRELQVHDMATLPEEQSKGYGGRLLNDLEKIAIEQRCGRMYVNSREDRSKAHDFYLRYGFKSYSLGFVKECRQLCRQEP